MNKGSESAAKWTGFRSAAAGQKGPSIELLSEELCSCDRQIGRLEVGRGFHAVNQNSVAEQPFAFLTDTQDHAPFPIVFVISVADFDLLKKAYGCRHLDDSLAEESRPQERDSPIRRALARDTDRSSDPGV